ncbi:hypothetical protein SAMN05443999_105128 [Roseovarius azorensis]|uniref:Sulfotransferase family protein n=1 Tax=Roseovarius azorensis TaxID=1287727 RepID=A0A1H7PYX0_9RHOB|nr:hypothetical protein [Roseovarius azorensis]SEL40952.1 hypothetical protein SAMN05443999_105128 [Roseovarius azorensis]
MAPSASRKRSFILSEGKRPGTDDPQRTYVIFGMPRGGTTMVAGVAALLGLDIGQDLPRNLEDPAFNLDVQHGTYETKLASIRRTIAWRNTEQLVWGWKFPNAARYLPKLADDIANPHLIIVFRDFPAESYRMHDHKGGSIEDLLGTYIRRLRQIKEVIALYKCPKMFLSYEKCIAEPDHFIDELRAFLGTTPPGPEAHAQIKAFMNPGSYKDLGAFT